MTLYLARKLVAGEVDETSTTYLGRCDEPDCRYLADHQRVEVVTDALEGHRSRAHGTGLTGRPEDATRTGWLTYGSSGQSNAALSWAPGPIAAGDDPRLHNTRPSPTPRPWCNHEWSVDAGNGRGYTAVCGLFAGHESDHEEAPK